MPFSLDASQPFDGPEVAATPLKPGTRRSTSTAQKRPAMNSNGQPIHWSEEGQELLAVVCVRAKVVDADDRRWWCITRRMIYKGTRPTKVFSWFLTWRGGYLGRP